jgi:hypothetical protein
MAKGDVFRFIYADSADPVTGVRVTRLSPPGTVCLRNYFYKVLHRLRRPPSVRHGADGLSDLHPWLAAARSFT